MGTSFLVVMGGNLNLKERIFIALAWLPKATVQVNLLFFFYSLKVNVGKSKVMVCGRTERGGGI